jgi:membrane fusion protein (multidrug efflux system)
MATTTLRTALFLSVTAVAVAGCGKSQDALFGGDQGPPRVVTVAVQQAVLPFQRRFPGQTVSLKDITLVAPVAGFLDAQPTPDGSVVKANTTLYRIRRVRYQADLTHAEGALAAVKAQLSNSEVALNRQEELWKKRNTSEADWMNARAQRDNSAAKVTEAEADRDIARINLLDTDINAPFAGQLGASKAHLGTWLNVGQAVGTLVQLDPIRVRFELPERLYLAHFADQTAIRRVAVRLLLSDGELFDQTGHIDFFDNRVDSATGSIAAYAILPNPQNRLRSGMYVRVLLEREIGIPTLLIPQSALLNDQLGQYVYSVDSEGKAQRRNVTVGDPVDSRIAILEGLAAGDPVVAEGLQRLRPGVAVQVVEGGTAPAPTGGAAKPAAGRQE